MMRIVRTRKVRIDGKEVAMQTCTRGPFLTETEIRDGRNRRLVVTLGAHDIRIRYARNITPLVVVSYEELVKKERTKKWKVGPRGGRRGDV